MNLLQASRKMLTKAQHCLFGSLIAGMAIFAITLFTFFDLSRKAEAVTLILISLIQLAQTFLKYRALYWSSLGDEPRRMEQFRSGLNLQPSVIKCAEIESLIGKCDAPIDTTYWLSTAPAGPRRMTEMILESSFYTRDIAKHCSRALLSFTLVGVLLAMTSLIMGYLGIVRAIGKPSQIIVAALIFFLTSDFLVMGLQYRDLASEASLSHEAAFTLLDECKADHSSALALAMTYNVASSQSPPLISWFHKRRSVETDALFRRHYLTLLTRPL